MAAKRPVPVNEEIDWDKSKTIKSKTNSKGIIDYVNDVFLDVSEYSREELIGKPHNIIRHPDMPKAIFKTLWDNLSEGTNFNAVVKNMTKSGKYYWIVTNFDIFKDSSGKPVSFMGVRTAVPSEVVNIIAPLYEKLLEIEAADGMEASVAHLSSFLADNGGSYGAFIKKIMSDNGVDVSFW